MSVFSKEPFRIIGRFGVFKYRSAIFNEANPKFFDRKPHKDLYCVCIRPSPSAILPNIAFSGKRRNRILKRMRKYQ